MANRKKPNKTASQGFKLDNIQIAAIAVIVIVLAVIIWLLMSNSAEQKKAVEDQSLFATIQAQAEQTALAKSAPESAPGQPGSQQAPSITAINYNAYPEMTIDANKEYLATVKMAKGGEFVIQLYPDKAPLTVNSFVFLAREGYFNGVTFHRVLDGFMAQGGDPTGTGMGGPGYEFVNEDSDLKFDKAGVVAMANAGRDTNGSQFFITFVPTPNLDGGYTIFGQVIEGMEVVNGITRRDPQMNPDFPGDAIESITITEK